MNNLKKQILALVICLAVITSLFSSVMAEEYDKLVISFKIGSEKAYVNSLEVKAEPPQLKGNNAFVPAKVVFEAFGAELNWKGQGKVNIIYRDLDIEFRIGNTHYTVNQEDRELNQAPFISGQSTMVPLQFIEENFDVSVEFDEDTGNISIVLEDDGALTDFSFLTNSIGKPKAGNSYFGWIIKVPNGSRLVDISFNSKYTYILNDHRALGIEVSVDEGENKSLDVLYDEICSNTYNFFNGMVLDSNLFLSAQMPYAEFIYLNSSEEWVMHRIYTNENKVYSVILTLYYETDPYRISNDRYLKEIMNSFGLGYDGSEKDVQDLSKVAFGFAKYENYVRFDYFNKYFNWEMNVVPEWDILNTGDNYPMHTRLGLNSDEFISVYTKKFDQSTDIESYGESIVRWNEKYLNKDCYDLLEKEYTQVSGYPAYRLTFRLTIGGKNYIVDDYYIPYGSFVYNLTVKAPEVRFATQQEIYNKMLDTFRINQVDDKSLVKEVDNYWIKYGNPKLGKDGETVNYQNKTFKWSARFPGYWEKYIYSDESLQLFMLPDTGVQIGIESIELNEYTKKFEYTERFSLVALLGYKYDMKELEKKTVYSKDTNVTMYQYRIDDEEQEVFADLKYYFIDTQDKSHCFMMYIPDLFSSDTVMDELGKIWESFTVEGD